MSFFRAEKGTPNSNAVRVLVPGLFAALVLLMLPGAWLMVWDEFFRDRPWVVAELAIIDEATNTDRPLVADKLSVAYPVYGDRFVWVEDTNGVRLCGTVREDSWPADVARVWLWDAFFNSQCAVPARPFRVCNAFHVFSPRGSEDTSGPFCSAVAAILEDEQ